MYYYIFNKNPKYSIDIYDSKNRILECLEPINDKRYIQLTEEQVIKIDSIQKSKDEIEKLKSKLNNSDYKILKCFETYMSAISDLNTELDINMPYELSELISERQTQRNQINILEKNLV